MDPSGKMTISQVVMAIGIGISLIGLTMMGIGKLTGKERISDIGFEIVLLGLAVFAGGGGAAALGLKTAVETVVVTSITTVITVIQRLTHHGVIKFNEERLNPGGELHHLVTKMVMKGGIPCNGIIIYADKSTISRHEGSLLWKTGTPKYRIGDRVLKYSVNMQNKTEIEITQFKITSTNPLVKEILMGPKTIECGATSSGLINDDPAWKWTVVQKEEEL